LDDQRSMGIQRGTGLPNASQPLFGSVLLTVEETATLLRTTPKAVYAMVARQQLPGVVRIGRRLLFRRADVMHWIDEMARGPR
jgi:excisionase family DNA binding protein